MKYQLVKKTPENQNLVVGFFSDEDIFLQSHIQEFGLSETIKPNLQPKTKNNGLWMEHSNQAVLLFNLGKRSKCSINDYQNSIKLILKQVKALKSESVTLCLPEIESCKDHAKLIVQSIEDNLYQFKISQKQSKVPSLTSISLLMNGSSNSIEQALAIARAIKLTKDLGNLPPILCTPTNFLEHAK
jgi:leucyl aminopeptidase